jgi:hypothetical protein
MNIGKTLKNNIQLYFSQMKYESNVQNSVEVALYTELYFIIRQPIYNETNDIGIILNNIINLNR